MKLNFFRFVTLVATLALLGSTAYAQSIHVRAHVPFDFAVGDRVYPAGEYTIQTQTNFNHLLYVGNRDTNESTMTRSYPTSSVKAERTELLFRRIGNAYFLSQVRVAESRIGREFPMSRLEIRMAQNGTNSETTIVTANSIH